MKIIPLKEGIFSADANKEFSLMNDHTESKGIKLSVQPFLIITDHDCILLDAGLGWKNEKGQLVIDGILEKENLNRKKITKVLISHLHKDHINGMMSKTGKSFESNFPDAEIYIQKREVRYAFENRKNPSFDFEILDALIQQPNISWMNEDNGTISEEISYEVVGGHTPFHQVFWIRNNGETLFYGADNLPQEAYLKYQIAYKTDYDGKSAMHKRMEWEKLAKQENWDILLYHDLEKSVVKLT